MDLQQGLRSIVLRCLTNGSKPSSTTIDEISIVPQDNDSNKTIPFFEYHQNHKSLIWIRLPKHRAIHNSPKVQRKMPLHKRSITIVWVRLQSMGHNEADPDVEAFIAPNAPRILKGTRLINVYRGYFVAIKE